MATTVKVWLLVQPDTTTAVWVTFVETTGPQASVALEAAATLASVGSVCGLQPRLRPVVGTVRVGGVVSTVQSMTCWQLAELPQASVATPVSVRVCTHPLTVSTWLRVIVGKAVQPSAALTA